MFFGRLPAVLKQDKIDRFYFGVFRSIFIYIAYLNRTKLIFNRICGRFPVRICANGMENRECTDSARVFRKHWILCDIKIFIAVIIENKTPGKREILNNG